MKPIIEVRNLSKRYRLGESANRFDTFMELVSHKLRQLGSDSSEDASKWIWSLREVCFDVEQGDLVGIIGRNGAGKSTLLKILSRITDPTEGYVKLRGRSSSLLEVGTGFHPDLTGRENIFLNGAILGMSRAEITSKFDEIVAFSEMGRFIDTPVKRYSSGMYVRLAFAVAAHLEPEILIVDEVLAVGDMAFQRKCLGKMGEVSKAGRTVLFVSHNMAAVENLCRTGIVLEGGKITFEGTSKEAVSHYIREVFGEGTAAESHIFDLRQTPNRAPKYLPMIERMELYSDDQEVVGGVAYGAPLSVQLTFRLHKPAPRNHDVLVSFNTLLGDPVFVAHSRFEPGCLVEQTNEEQVFRCEIPSLTLVPGEYMINVAIASDNTLVDCIEHASRLSVTPVDYYGTGKVPRHGTAVLPHRWHRGVRSGVLVGAANTIHVERASEGDDPADPS